MFYIGAPFRRMKLFQILCLSFSSLLFFFLSEPNIFAQDDSLPGQPWLAAARRTRGPAGNGAGPPATGPRVGCFK